MTKGNLTVGQALTADTALTLTAGKLTLTGGTAKSLAVVTGTLALAANTTLGTTSGTLSSLELGTHTLTVNGGTLAASALSFSTGGGLTLGVAKDSGGNLTGAKLTLKSALTGSDKLKLTLTLVGTDGTLEVKDFATDKGYALFTETDWTDEDLLSKLDLSVTGITLGSYDSWHIDNQGKLTIKEVAGDLTWIGTSGSNDWSMDAHATNWYLDETHQDVEFASGRTTVFNVGTTHGTSVSTTVNVSASGETLQAAAMKVENGAFTFTGDTLSASTLSVESGATATFRNTATFSGALSAP